MKTPLRWILLLILLLSLAGLACETVMGSEEAADDSPQPQATVATDSQEQPAATPVAESADSTESAVQVDAQGEQVAAPAESK